MTNFLIVWFIPTHVTSGRICSVSTYRLNFFSCVELIKLLANDNLNFEERMGQVLKDSELNEQAGENVECANICRVYLLLLYKQGICYND